MSHYVQIVIQKGAKILKIMSDEESKYICAWIYLANNSMSKKGGVTYFHICPVFSEVNEKFLRG